MLPSQNMLLFLLACCLTDHTTPMSCWRWLLKADVRQSALTCDRLEFVCGHVLEPGKRGTARPSIHHHRLQARYDGRLGRFLHFCLSIESLAPHRETTPLALMGPLGCRNAMLSVTPHGSLCKPAWPVATQPATVRHRGLRPLGRRGAERPPSPLPHRLRECSRCFT